MNCKKPIKAVSPEKMKENVYRIEKSADYFRISITSDSEDMIYNMMTELVKGYGSKLEVLIDRESDKFDEKENSYIWDSYYGIADDKSILEILNDYHDLIFHDGKNVLMIKMFESDKYFAFDECGILYVYNHPEFEDYLEDYDFMEVFSDYYTIIYFGHWHYMEKNAEEDIQKLIKYLNLKKE